MINDLKEKVDEKDIEISNLQHSKTSAKGVVIPARTGDERIRVGRRPATIGLKLLGLCLTLY